MSESGSSFPWPKPSQPVEPAAPPSQAVPPSQDSPSNNPSPSAKDIPDWQRVYSKKERADTTNSNSQNPLGENATKTLPPENLEIPFVDSFESDDYLDDIENAKKAFWWIGGLGIPGSILGAAGAGMFISLIGFSIPALIGLSLPETGNVGPIVSLAVGFAMCALLIWAGYAAEHQQKWPIWLATTVYLVDTGGVGLLTAQTSGGLGMILIHIIGLYLMVRASVACGKLKKA